MGAITIQFLGTSSAHPIPRWGCSCPQCSEARANPRYRRTRSAIVVNRSLLVDAGPDIYDQLRRLPYNELHHIDNIIITHPHADHYLGLDDLSGLRRISSLPVLPICMIADGWSLVQRAFRYLIAAETSEYDKRPFARREMSIDEPVQLHDGLVVTPFDSRHTQPFTTAALLLEKDGKKVFYSPDFYNTDTERLCDADLMILDGSFLTRESMRSRYTPHLEEGMGRHRPIVEELAWARSMGAKQVIFTHLGHLRKTTAELMEFLDNDLCSLATDGLEVTV